MAWTAANCPGRSVLCSVIRWVFDGQPRAWLGALMDARLSARLCAKFSDGFGAWLGAFFAFPADFSHIEGLLGVDVIEMQGREWVPIDADTQILYARIGLRLYGIAEEPI